MHAAIALHVRMIDDHIVHAGGERTPLERREQLRRNPDGAGAVFVGMAGVSGGEHAEAG
jgi:hypothetical protein